MFDLNSCHKSGLLKKDVPQKQYVSHKGLVELIEKAPAESYANSIYLQLTLLDLFQVVHFFIG